MARESLNPCRRLRWKIGDFLGRWISARLGSWIEGESW
jgi:hypothetical protein